MIWFKHFHNMGICLQWDSDQMPFSSAEIISVKKSSIKIPHCA